jgi:hypothetical protein
MSRLIPRSVLIAGSKTSLRLEEAFWGGAAGNCRQTRHDLVRSNWHHRCATSVWESIICSSAVVLEFYRSLVSDANSGISVPNPPPPPASRRESPGS